jgi:hypothetical protein
VTEKEAVAKLLEEVVDLLSSGRTISRHLTPHERQTVAAFKVLLVEVLNERRIELTFDAEQSRKKVARLREGLGMLEFTKAFIDDVRHPVEGQTCPST